MSNPVIAEVTRGGIVESRHAGAYAVVDSAGRLIASGGDAAQVTFPRSAIKAFQCLPVVESGAADRFGLNGEEIALCCSSHNGEAEHVRVARSLLAKAGNSEADYECGAHWPVDLESHAAAALAAPKPLAVHNNCSGKHAGMLALSRQIGADPKGYTRPDHPVQRVIARAMGEICDCDLARQPVGVDGCSVPTWAMPLKAMALGFARLSERPAGKRIIEAVRGNPFMVAGSNRYDTDLMAAVPRIFAKGGAEGVHCGAIPHAGVGIAVKCDDGAGRAGEVIFARVAGALDAWTSEERAAIAGFARHDLKNWRGIVVGEVRSA